jgi:hypothetical protein
MKKWVLLVLIVLFALLLLIWFGRMQSQTDETILENAIRNGLKECYATIDKSKTLITPEYMKNVIQDNLYVHSSDKKHLLPSFIKSEDVYYSTIPVAMDSSNIICTIRLRETAYVALEGDGECTLINKDEVRGWPHTQ